MKYLVVFLMSAFLVSSFSAEAKVVSSGKKKVQITVSTTALYKVVETEAACVFTYDPQWADEEDTRAAKIIYEKISDLKQIEALRRNNYRLTEMISEECSVNATGEKSSFPKVLTKKGELFFSQYVKAKDLVATAKKQKAFKKIKLIMVKGFAGLDKSFAKKTSQKRNQFIKLIRQKQ